MVAMVYFRGCQFFVLGFLTFDFVSANGFSQEKAPSTQDKVFAEPLVARVELRLSIGDKEVDVIEKGDLLTVLEEREKSYLIRTFRGIKGGIDKAIVDFTKAIELSPNFIPAIMGRGYVYFQKGEHAKAVDDFTKVIELNGRAAVAFNNRGYNYQQIGKFKEALDDFKKAVELTPDYALAHQNLGWLLATCRDESLRDAITAIASASKACELNEYNDLSDRAALAASHAAAKEFSLAIDIQEKIVERAPAPQKPLAEKLLELYRNEKSFDPELKMDLETEKPNAEIKSDAKR